MLPTNDISTRLVAEHYLSVYHETKLGRLTALNCITMVTSTGYTMTGKDGLEMIMQGRGCSVSVDNITEYLTKTAQVITHDKRSRV